jgi:hypothetical protein
LPASLRSAANLYGIFGEKEMLLSNKIWFEPICFQVLWQFGVCAAEPLIFAPPHLSHALRGEGRTLFELFLKYTANLFF